MKLPIFIKKAATFADAGYSGGPMASVWIYCDGLNDVIVRTTDGRSYCQYEIPAVEDEGTWSASVHHKDWAAHTNVKGSGVKAVNVTKEGDSVCIAAHPAGERNQRVLVEDQGQPGRDFSIEQLLADEYSATGRIDPVYLKKVAEAAIAAKMATVSIMIPDDSDKPLLVKGTAPNYGDGKPYPAKFLIAQMAPVGEEAAE